MSEARLDPMGGDTAGASLAPEDQARADFFALLARLYAAGPDDALLQAIAGAPALAAPAFMDRPASKAAHLADAWDALRAVSSGVRAEAAAQEYVDLFVGVGKCEVNLHASHWLTGFMMEKPLADLRATLARLGIARQAQVSMVEDHLSALCETMRILIAGRGQRPPAGIAEQHVFFARHIEPWIDKCCHAISRNPIAIFYGRVAEFTECLIALERESFAIQ